MESTQGRRAVQTFNFGNCEVSAKGCKNNKILHKIEEVWIMTLGSTHGDEEKYTYSVFGSAAFT
jgi:hypothetical protein